MGLEGPRKLKYMKNVLSGACSVVDLGGFRKVSSKNSSDSRELGSVLPTGCRFGQKLQVNLFVCAPFPAPVGYTCYFVAMGGGGTSSRGPLFQSELEVSGDMSQVSESEYISH